MLNGDYLLIENLHLERDFLFELEQWVEKDQAPDFIVARQLDAAGVEQRSRPICSYPSVARLRAGKNPDNFDSYQCINNAPAAVSDVSGG